jgi:hypothetical protein
MYGIFNLSLLLCAICAGNAVSQCIDMPNIDHLSKAAAKQKADAVAEINAWVAADPAPTPGTANAGTTAPAGTVPTPNFKTKSLDATFDKAKYESWAALKAQAENTTTNFVTLDVHYNTSIKLAVDTDVDSGYLQGEDYVVFTVVQDVYLDNDKDNAGERCLWIPQGTRVYV